jgi:hypothetical protein
MWNPNQPSSLSSETNAPPLIAKGDILWIQNLDIQYNPDDLKNLSPEEIRNIHADIEYELGNPWVDLNERIHAILKLSGIKTILIESSKPPEWLW